MSFPASNVEYTRNGGQNKWLEMTVDQLGSVLWSPFLFFYNKASKEEK